VTVAETQSFRRAAERCPAGQPALSGQIGVLERSLIRSNRSDQTVAL